MFIPDGPDHVVATVLTQGPWDSNAQYGGTPAALCAWAVERVPTLVPMRIARLTVDMHRSVPLGRLGVSAEVVREGKRLQLVLVRVTDPAGTEVARATALRFRTADGPDDAVDPWHEPIPSPPTGGPTREGHAPRNGLNGFAGARGPRFGDGVCPEPQTDPITYPFTSHAGDGCDLCRTALPRRRDECGGHGDQRQCVARA